MCISELQQVRLNATKFNARLNILYYVLIYSKYLGNCDNHKVSSTR